MTIPQAIILGAVQGITEFLPVSSSGHLILFPALLGWPEQGIVFDVAVHAATLCATLLALRKDIADILGRCFRGERAAQMLVAKIAVATVPIVLVGFFWQSTLEGWRSPDIVAVSLIVWGLLLAAADRYTAMMRGQVADPSKVRWGQAMFIGFMQIFSLIPGTSRSGSTITAGLFSGVDRSTAAKFSFLLAVPATAGVIAKTTFDVAHTGLDLPVLTLLAGFLSALVCGILAIRLLLLILKRATFIWFAVYRVALGVFVLLYL